MTDITKNVTYEYKIRIPAPTFVHVATSLSEFVVATCVLPVLQNFGMQVSRTMNVSFLTLADKYSKNSSGLARKILFRPTALNAFSIGFLR